MKTKFNLKILLLVIMLVIMMTLVTNVYAASSYKLALKPSKREVNKGDEVTVSVNLSSIQDEKGIIALGATLEYDETSLELVKMEDKGDWSKPTYNEVNGKLVTDRNGYATSNETVFTITFKVKEESKANLEIVLSNISASNGEQDIKIDDINTTISVKSAENEDPPIYTAPEDPIITSEKYNVQKEEKVITKILPNTNLKEFIANIKTNTSIVITDKYGNVLSEDNTIIGTGMKLKAGDLEVTLVVTGDLNGDGQIEVTDFEKLKLHYIKREELTGAYLKAADIDGNNKIGIIDVAQIKLVLIGLMVIK